MGRGTTQEVGYFVVALILGILLVVFHRPVAELYRMLLGWMLRPFKMKESTQRLFFRATAVAVGVVFVTVALMALAADL
jgi:hypothetical protein